MVIQAWHQLDLFAAVFFENLLVFLSDLNERLQAIRHKRRAEHEQAFVTCLPTLHNHVIAERPQPFAVQPTLKAYRVAVFGQTQAPGQRSTRRVAL